MKTHILFGIIFGLMLVGCVFAQNSDVSISISPEEISVNPYEIAVYDILVENKGEDNSFTLSVAGIPEEWFSLSHESIEILSSESKIIYLFITPQPAEQDIYVGKASIVEFENIFSTFTLNIIKDHKVRVSMPRQLSSCICEEDQTAIIVENLGKYSEDIDLFLTGDGLDVIDVEMQSFTLEVNETKEIPTRILAMCDTEERVYTLEVNVESRSSYASASVSSRIEKKECFDFETSYPEEVRSCSGVEKTFTIEVANTGIKKDNYEVNIEELGYSDIIELEPGQAQMFEILFIKDEEGVYEIPFQVSSDTREEQGLVKFIVEKCFGVDLELDVDELTIQSGTGRLTKPLVKNIGTRPSTYDVEVSANWAAVRPPQLTLLPNETQNIFVYYSPEYGLLGEYEVQVSVESDYAYDSETVKVNVEEEVITTTTFEEVPATVEENVTTTTEEIPEPPEVNITKPTGMFGRVWEKVEIFSNRITQKVEELKINKMVFSLVIGFVIALIILIVVYLVVMR